MRFSDVAPVVYVFYVKDFAVNSATLRFPEEFRESVRSQDILYLVKAVIHHEGPSRQSGHFKAFIKSDNKVWYCIDDETVRMVTWEVVSKCRAYAVLYQKLGDREAAREFLASQTALLQQEARIKTIVDENEADKKEKEDRRKNPMVELFLDEKRPEPALEEPRLAKRKPFYPIRDPLSQLRKLKALASLRPNLEQHGPQTQKVSSKDIQNHDIAGTLAWDASKQDAVAALESTHRFMLGRIERQRDQYDVEYDMGKLKKVKKKKLQQKINFDKQAKRLSKQKSTGSR